MQRKVKTTFSDITSADVNSFSRMYVYSYPPDLVTLWRHNQHPNISCESAGSVSVRIVNSLTPCLALQSHTSSLETSGCRYKKEAWPCVVMDDSSARSRSVCETSFFFFFSIRIRPTPVYDPSRLVVRSAAWRCVHSKNLHCTSVESINRFFFVVVVVSEHTVSDFSTKSVVYLMFINSLPHSWLVIYTLCPLTDCKDTFIWGKKNTPPRRLAKKKKIPHSTRLSAEETLTSIFVREK